MIKVKHCAATLKVWAEHRGCHLCLSLQQRTLPLNVGLVCGFWCQHHFIRWISCWGVPTGMQFSAGRSPFLTHWQIWSSLLASEQKHGVTVAETRPRLALLLTLVWLHSCEDDPHHDRKAVDVGLLGGGRVYAIQVLGRHVAQGASPSPPGWLPFLAPSAGLLLCEFAPKLRYG